MTQSPLQTIERFPNLCDEESMAEIQYWLLKTEPETYSFDQLMVDRRTPWNGVRNYQARNFLNQMKVSDIALIYHSGESREVVGVAEVTRAAYPDPDLKRPGDWVQVEIEAVQPFKKPVSLKVLKVTESLSDLPLFKQSRLSVMPIAPDHYQRILKLGEVES